MSERQGASLGRYAAAALIAVGLAALYEATEFAFGTVRQPATGFFPTLVAGAVVFFAAIAFAERPKPESDSESSKAGGAGRVWTVVTALAVYAVAFKAVGYIICTALLLVVLLRGVGRVSWTATATGVLFGAIGCYWMFTRLGLPLPDGLFGF